MFLLEKLQLQRIDCLPFSVLIDCQRSQTLWSFQDILFDNNEDGGNNILQYAKQCGEDLETIRITSIVDANTHSKLKDPKHFEVSQDILFYCNDDEDNNILQHAKQFEYLETIRIMSMTMPIFIQNLKIPNTLNFHRTFLTIVRMKILWGFRNSSFDSRQGGRSCAKGLRWKF